MEKDAITSLSTENLSGEGYDDSIHKSEGLICLYVKFYYGCTSTLLGEIAPPPTPISPLTHFQILKEHDDYSISGQDIHVCSLGIIDVVDRHWLIDKRKGLCITSGFKKTRQDSFSVPSDAKLYSCSNVCVKA